MTAQLDIVQFHGDRLLATKVDGKPYIVLKTLFENIGVDADRQIKNVRKQPWSTTSVTAVVAADGKVRDMVTADVRTVLMSLATIPVGRVAEAARPKLIAYQNQVADAVEDFYTKGAAINPQITETQVETTKQKMDEILLARRQEQLDYRQVTRALHSGGAISKDYAQVQDTLYLGLFGASARTMIRGRQQVSGERYKVGYRKGQLRPSTVAKNYLTQQELAQLNNAVLMMTSTLAIRFPEGTSTLDDVKNVAIFISQQAQIGRRQLLAA